MSEADTTPDAAKAAEGSQAADDAFFAEFAKAKDAGTAIADPGQDQPNGDGGKAADQDAGKVEADGAAKAAQKETPPAKGQPKADELADDPKALKAALEAAKSDVETLRKDFHAYKSQEGRRQAAANGKNVPGVEVPKTAAVDDAAAKAAPKKDEDDPLTSPEFLKVKEEYGDVITPLEKVIKHLQSKLEAVEGRTATAEKDLSGLTAEKANEFVATETATLASKHKDWLTIVQSEDFEKWLQDQPTEVQGLVLKNADRIVDAKAGARAIDFYKSDRGIGREPAPAKDAPPAGGKSNGKGQNATVPAQADRRSRQLEGSTSIPDRGPGPAGGPTGDDEVALFRHFAAQKDKDMAAGRM